MKQQQRGAVSRLVRRAGAVAAAAVIVGAGTVTTAAAAPGTEQVLGRSELSFAPAHLSDSAARARVITCEMVFIGANHGAPHHSGHVPGTVNVRVRVTCSQPVRMIRAKIGLFSNHGSKINPYNSVGKATARGNAALVCRSGSYQGESVATVTAPAGYSPPSATMRAKTAKVHLTRC